MEGGRRLAEEEGVGSYRGEEVSGGGRSGELQGEGGRRLAEEEGVGSWSGELQGYRGGGEEEVSGGGRSEELQGGGGEEVSGGGSGELQGGGEEDALPDHRQINWFPTQSLKSTNVHAAISTIYSCPIIPYSGKIWWGV